MIILLYVGGKTEAEMATIDMLTNVVSVMTVFVWDTFKQQLYNRYEQNLYIWLRSIVYS